MYIAKQCIIFLISIAIFSWILSPPKFRGWWLQPKSPTTVLKFVAIGWTVAWNLLTIFHPVLKAADSNPYCLALVNHRIDWRCPPMDLRFIRRLCLHCFTSGIHLPHLNKGPLVYPTYLVLLFSSHFGKCCFASLGSQNVYKDMHNNMVSPISHVVMNHQNQNWINGIWGTCSLHQATHNSPPPGGRRRSRKCL